MVRSIFVLLVAIYLPTVDVGSALVTVGCDCSANVFNCSDFGSHAAAQACFDHCMAMTGFDVHGLDQNNNGDACESLP